jgi:hypothetical protein
MHRIEPAEPIDKIEPVEPIDKIDPVEPIDRIDPLEPRLRIDPREPRLTIAPDEPAERDEPPLIAMGPFCRNGHGTFGLTAWRGRAVEAAFRPATCSFGLQVAPR